eukprot:TRINITY_DN10076_c0_g1_i9.p1 TRINITY_DN10076_c0_g1~~TRINITY_DN10076_c0_g1_i9.p1  ORF type:complete len:125 (-),score=11.71 TRINITY_DN10076_c0_g1_i9:331-705(-)
MVSYTSFVEFWKCFGRSLHMIRFHKVILRLWQIGLLYGFMSREDVNTALLGHEPGTFIIRFSESYPGQFVIGYVSMAGKLKHYLVERVDIEKKSLPDFLLDCCQFLHILQEDCESVSFLVQEHS